MESGGYLSGLNGEATVSLVIHERTNNATILHVAVALNAKLL